jgi:integrase
MSGALLVSTRFSNTRYFSHAVSNAVSSSDPSDSLEWADMQFLLWDAQRRMGISDEFITRVMVEKLAINKSRQWPKLLAVPDTLPCRVELKPGLIIGKEVKTEILLNALQRRAEYYAVLDAMAEQHAEHDASIAAFKAMLLMESEKGQSQNLWKFAIDSGLQHGELAALAWEV